ncbi:MAG: SRPBCC family protein [Actinomycetota bacterium]
MPAHHRRKRFELERSAAIAAPPEAVLDRITSPSTWPEWQLEIDSTEGPANLSTGDVVHGKASMLGFEVDGQSVASSVTESSFTEQVVVGVGMTVTYTLRPGPTGTVLTHKLVTELPGGPLGRLLSFFLKRRFRKMQSTLLRRLAEQHLSGVD